MVNNDEALKALDKIINKSRIHFYKPIQTVNHRESYQ